MQEKIIKQINWLLKKIKKEDNSSFVRYDITEDEIEIKVYITTEFTLEKIQPE